MECSGYDQYVIKIHGSGRMTTRNKNFLRKIEPYGEEPLRHSTPMMNPTISPKPIEESEVQGPFVTEPVPGVQEDPATEMPIQVPVEEPMVDILPRRSASETQKPDRLNIGNTGTKSYY